MLKIYNTLTRKKETFKPIKKGEVGIYSCGPTVYNLVHIGNLRAFVFYDLLRRYLEFLDYKVTQVMNITDVDDKTIKGSQNEKKSLKDFTSYYSVLFFKNLHELNIEKFEVYPKATEHIQEMVDIIKALEKNGYAYKTDDGIYFKISKFKNYGKLANIKTKNLKTGASGRVKADEYKKEQAEDFALWKFWKPEDGDVFWETEIGKGRPGWHIECSAMSSKYLGQPFDIHTGGIDLIFPHHTNEIAQSEAANGKKFVNYWIHNAHLLVNGEKMSKSLGNFYTLEDLKKKGYVPPTIRFFFLSSHYRQSLNLTFEALDGAKEAVERIRNFVSSAKNKEDHPEMLELIARTDMEFKKAMDNDLNTPEAFAAIFNFIKESNKLGAGEKAANFIKKLDSILGILKEEEEVPEKVKELAEEREEARKSKDWKKSDKFRDKIKDLGWEVRDEKDGFVLRKI
jgi:cysteinyl-tRNA synthetase